MRTWLVILGLLTVAAPGLFAEERPAIGVEQVVALAQNYLKESGHSGTHWISSVTLEPETIARRKFQWAVKWSPAIPLDGRKELGLLFNMDGTFARSVDKKAK